jgi:hypothetical protein
MRAETELFDALDHVLKFGLGGMCFHYDDHG